MASWVDGLARNGVGLLFLVCLVEALGLPVPAAVALLTAGALVAAGKMTLGLVLLAAILAFFVGDTLYFYLGRKTGWWLLGVLCRVSMNPDTCILSSAEAFYRRGRVVLLFAKFLPGLNTMAPPLAGSMRMSTREFLLLDGAGIVIYVSTYVGIGYSFQDILANLLATMGKAGQIVEIALFGGFLIFVGYRAWLAWKSRIYRTVPRAKLSEVDGRIFDVRSHGYYEDGAQRILGSSRLEPNRLPEAIAGLQDAGRIYLYCTCRDDATSTRVAHILREHGFDAQVISGGLNAWKRAGLPIESVPDGDIVQLPTFARR